jgi:tetratricopeptide (TPR) repeat protein
MNSAQALNLAVQQHQAGNLHEAEQLYRQILLAEPRHVDALHLLGVIAHQVGQHERAVEHIRAALRERPNFADAHCNLGAAVQALGQLEEAVACFRQAVYLKPDYAEAHNNLGNALRLQGKPAEALVHLQHAVNLRPNYAGALTNLGLVLQKLGRLGEAATHHEQALWLMPNLAEAHINLGIARQEQGMLDEAAVNYERALRLKPNSVEAHHNLGGILKIQGRLEEAVASYERALSLKPDYADAHNNLGTALHAQGKLDEAAASFQQAVRLKPDFAEAHANLAGVLNLLGKHAEAAARCEHALRYNADSAQAHSILGNIHKDQGKLDLALASYERALLLDPDNGKNHVSRALLWLLQGNFEKGWVEYEWRWNSSATSPRQLPQPRWQGDPLAGRTILLHAEQGMGDTLQLVRYIALVRAQGAGSVVLECQPSLARLLAGQTGLGADRVVPQGEPLPSFDVHAALFSLPRLLGTTSVERIPADIPYLRADPDLVQHWRARLESLEVDRTAPRRLRVGIAWQGNTDHKADRWRSVPLDRFTLLSAIPGVRLISLQKGAGVEQLHGLNSSGFSRGLPFDLGTELTDFADTAAVLQCLDLVITVDTALAHLAGALGVEAWVALPFAPDWRWLLEREDSPWYPSLRLFRQKQPADWGEVFARIAAAVKERIALGS